MQNWTKTAFWVVKTNYNSSLPYWPFISYNKTEDDFASLKDYNDYLEEIETLSKFLRTSCYPFPPTLLSPSVYNLANNIDTEITKEKIELYKKENQANIIKNRQKLVSETVTIHADFDLSSLSLHILLYQF